MYIYIYIYRCICIFLYIYNAGVVLVRGDLGNTVRMDGVRRTPWDIFGCQTLHPPPLHTPPLPDTHTGRNTLSLSRSLSLSHTHTHDELPGRFSGEPLPFIPHTHTH